MRGRSPNWQKVPRPIKLCVCGYISTTLNDTEDANFQLFGRQMQENVPFLQILTKKSLVLVLFSSDGWVTANTHIFVQILQKTLDNLRTSFFCQTENSQI